MKMGMDLVFPFVFCFYLVFSVEFCESGATGGRVNCLEYFSACECGDDGAIVCTRANSIDYHLVYLTDSPYFGAAAKILFTYFVSFDNLVFLCESGFTGHVLGLGTNVCERLNACGVNCESEESEHILSKTNHRGEGAGKAGSPRVHESKNWIFGLVAFIILLVIFILICFVCGCYLRGWKYLKKQFHRKIQVRPYNYFSQGCDLS